MMLRSLTLLALCSLPLAAQAKPTGDADNLFYRAFFLERGQRDYARAAELYQEFLAKAPQSRFAARAVRSAYGLLARLGRAEDASALRMSHVAILGKGELVEEIIEEKIVEEAVEAKAKDQDAAKPDAARGANRGRRGSQRGRGGQRDRGGRGGRRGAFGILSGDQKLTEMDDEALAEFRSGLERISGFVDRMREAGRDEQADQLESSILKINKHLDAGKIAAAQKDLEELRSAFRRR